MTRRALRQKSSSNSISGASARVRISPRSCFACNSSSEYILVSSFAIVAYLPCADNPAILPAPGVHDKVIILVDMSQSTDTHLAVILSIVFGFQHGIGKNERGICKVYPVFVEVLAPFLFIPFKAHASILYKRIYDVKASSRRVVYRYRVLMQWTRHFSKWPHKARMISGMWEIIHKPRRRVQWHR